MNLLFITSSRIGDAILTTGLLQHFIQSNPDIHITVAAASLTAPLFEGVPNLKKNIIMEKKSLSRHWIDLWQECRHQKWDVVIDTRGSAVSYFLKTSQRYVWRTPSVSGHRVDQLGHLIGIFPPPSPHLWLRERDLQKAEQFIPATSSVLAIAPAANWIGKQWPTASFVRLLTQFLSTHNAKIAVFAAPHERAMIQPILEAIPAEKCLDLVGKLSLLEIAACLKRCSLFLGNDSGLMHMSAAIGTPTIGLFGPSDEKVYGPYSKDERHHVIRIPDSLEDLKKKPGFAFNASQTFMNSLTPEMVYLTLEKLWLQKKEAS